jgi:hypothetical protein
MVDNRHVQNVFRPFDGGRICALARQKQRAQRRDVVTRKMFGVGILDAGL